MFAAQDGSTPNGKLWVDEVFSPYLYQGNGSTQTINNGIDLAGKGGLVWIKNRAISENHLLKDTARGSLYLLATNTTGAEVQNNYGVAYGGFNSNGFTAIGDTYNYASWTFRKAPKFFDVVTWTGDGVSGRQIAHNLGVAPGMIIVKCTNASSSWWVYHRSLSAYNSNMNLDGTGAVQTTGAFGATPSESSFTPGGWMNNTGDTYVAYLFAHDPSADGIIQCGSFTVSGDTDVPFGWEPQFLMTKRVDASSSYMDWWNIFDSMRGFSQSGSQGLFANTSDAEASRSPAPIPTASGLKTNGYFQNGGTYIYLAIRRPNKPPTSGTQVYNAIARTGTGAAARVTGVGFAPDLFLSGDRSTGNAPSIFVDKLRGVNKELAGWSTNAEYAATGSVTGFENNGVTFGANTDSLGVNVSGRNYIEWIFRRAPGFFDVVTWTGTGAARTVSHNLVAVPELIIGKCINYPQEWYVYSAATGNSYSLQLQSNAAAVFSGTWNYQNPTVSSIYLASPGDGGALNTSSRTFIGYLFASLPGISKVSSYTGNGTSQTINCGFTTGARFILIKRTDAVGDWYVWDSARGIVAANDPHLSLNTTAAEVTTDDSVDPDASGFIVNQVAATNINVSGGSYIFLAVA